MKNLLEINNNVLTISPEALTINEFADIWNRDKSKDKARARAELGYIYHSTDFKSLYRQFHSSTREAQMRFDIFKDRDWQPDTAIILAQNKYKELQTTLSIELLNDAETGLEKLRDYFRNANFDEDDEGKSAKNFIANIKQLGDLVKGMKSLREEVEKELVDQMQLRGNSEIGRRELPPDRRG